MLKSLSIITGIILIFMLNTIKLRSQVSSKQSTAKRVFADYFTGFKTREHSRDSAIWRYYCGENVNNSSDLYIKPGGIRKQTSTPYYPIIGPYDTLDPDVLEYHILLAKLAGIDGFFCEYSLHNNHDSRAVVLMSKIAKKLNFQVGINWIPINFTSWSPGLNNRQDLLNELEKTYQLIIEEIYSTAGIMINGKPVILIFDVQPDNYPKNKIKGTFFSKSEIKKMVKSIHDLKPLIISRSIRKKNIPVIKGFYKWIIPVGSKVPENSIYDCIGDLPLQKQRLKEFYQKSEKLKKNKKIDLFFGSVWPGFDDHLGRAWGEDIARYTPRHNGQTLLKTWELAKKSKADHILIITWNDWVESTIIEPSMEFGYHDIKICQNQIADWKNIQLSNKSLYLPEKLFNIRKKIKQFQKIGFPSTLFSKINKQLNYVAKRLSEKNWKKAKHQLQTIEKKIQMQFEKKIKTKNIELIFKAGEKKSDLNIINRDHKELRSNNLLPVSIMKNKKTINYNEKLILVIDQQAKKSLKKRYTQGRLRISHYSANNNWIKISQGGPNIQNNTIADFKKKKQDQWQTVEMDIIPAFVPDSGFQDCIFTIESSNDKKNYIHEIRLILTTYTIKK